MRGTLWLYRRIIDEITTLWAGFWLLFLSVVMIAFLSLDQCHQHISEEDSQRVAQVDIGDPGVDIVQIPEMLLVSLLLHRLHGPTFAQCVESVEKQLQINKWYCKQY